MSCLIILAELSNELELITLIDIMKDIKIAKKYLYATMDAYNTTMFHKTTINFNVMINHREKGLLMFARRSNTRANNIEHFNYSARGSWVSTSLCPTLGKMYAQEHSGACPGYLQEPYGKTLNILFVGLPPWIIYNPLGGSEFIVTALLAKKFHFVPNYILWDPLEDNDLTFYGKVSPTYIQ